MLPMDGDRWADRGTMAGIALALLIVFGFVLSLSNLMDRGGATRLNNVYNDSPSQYVAEVRANGWDNGYWCSARVPECSVALHLQQVQDKVHEPAPDASVEEWTAWFNDTTAGQREALDHGVMTSRWWFAGGWRWAWYWLAVVVGGAMLGIPVAIAQNDWRKGESRMIVPMGSWLYRAVLFVTSGGGLRERLGRLGSGGGEAKQRF